MRQETQSAFQIQEPALKEIKKHHSCLTGSFLTGGGCIIIFIGVCYFAARLIVGSGPTTLTLLPTDWPRDVPQMNPDKIIKIVQIDATTKKRALWTATAIPRLLLASTLGELDPDATISEQKDSLGRVAFRKELVRSDYLDYLRWPTGADNTKTVIVTWNSINSYPSLMAEQMANKLRLKNFVITDRPVTDNQASFAFQHNTISGTFRAIDMKPDQAGTEFAELVVNYP